MGRSDPSADQQKGFCMWRLAFRHRMWSLRAADLAAFFQHIYNPRVDSAHTPGIATFDLDQLGMVRWEKKGLMRRAQNFVTKELQAGLHH